MSNGRNIFVFCLFMFSVLFAVPSISYAQDEYFRLGSSASAATFDFYPSGYSDGWYWGASSDPNRHAHWTSGSHEMLSGEWSAGLAYSVSGGTTKFQWLLASKYPAMRLSPVR
jgi:hypothetical protein